MANDDTNSNVDDGNVNSSNAIDATAVADAHKTSSDSQDSTNTTDKVDLAEFKRLQKRLNEVNAENKKYREKANLSTQEAKEARELAAQSIEDTKKLHALADQRLIRAELKVLAKTEGLVDEDAFKMVDQSKIKVDENGDVVGAAQLIADLKKSKPYLFQSNSSSPTHDTPNPAKEVEREDVMQLSDKEYQEKYPAKWRRSGMPS